MSSDPIQIKLSPEAASLLERAKLQMQTGLSGSELDTTMTVLKIKELTDDNNKLAQSAQVLFEKYNKLVKEYNALATNAQALKAACEELHEQNQNLANHCQVLQQALDAAKHASADSQKKAVQDGLREKDGQIEKLRENIRQMESRMDRSERELKETREKLQQSQAQLRDLNRRHMEMTGEDWLNRKFVSGTGKPVTPGGPVDRDFPQVKFHYPTERLSNFEGAQDLKRKAADHLSQLLKGNGPKDGMLFYGVSGTGKSLLVRALCGELGCSMFRLTPSDFHDRVDKVRDYLDRLFRKLQDHPQSVLFLDDVDEIFSGADSQSKAIASYFSRKMEETRNNPGRVIVMAATKRPERLDDSLLKPGVFGLKFHVGNPDLQTRKQIVGKNLRNLSGEVESGAVSFLADATEGFSCSDLDSLFQRIRRIVQKNNISTFGIPFFRECLRGMSPSSPRESVSAIRDWEYKHHMANQH